MDVLLDATQTIPLLSFLYQPYTSFSLYIDGGGGVFAVGGDGDGRGGEVLVQQHDGRHDMGRPAQFDEEACQYRGEY